MKFYRETTGDWTSPTPNHIYLLSTDKSKMYGYIKAGTEEVTVMKSSYRFDARRRTFQEVRELGEIDLDQVKSEKWEFTGSKGDTYVVQKIDNMLQCTCPGFTFRGDCKHIKSVENQK
jgi:hypothetical protein